MPQRTLSPVFPESCHSFLLLQWRQARRANPLPPLAAGSQPSAAPQGRPSAPPARGSCGRFPSAAPRPPPPCDFCISSLVGWKYPLSTPRPTRDSTPAPSTYPYLPALALMLWLWRTSWNSFFTNLMRTENMLRCVTNDQIFLKDIKKPHHKAQLNRVCILLGKRQSVTTRNAQTGHWQKSPLVWLPEESLPIKELGDSQNQLAQESGVGGYSLKKEEILTYATHEWILRTLCWVK